MPDLMREVVTLLPSRHRAFQWAGSNAEIVNEYSSFPPALVELYLKEFSETPQERKLKKPFSTIKTWPASKPVSHLNDGLRVDFDTFLRSAYYNELWRPAEILEQLLLLIRDADSALGVMFVYRAPGDPPYEPRDIRMLASIRGFVAHGMTHAAPVEDAFAESDDRGLFVVAMNGSVQHATIHAQRLLMMALSPRWSPADNWRALREPAPEIAALCNVLAATANGHIGQPPPMLRRRTLWGEFVLRSHWFRSTDGVEQTRHVGITIERRVPRALALRRRVEHLPLTAREKQVCLLLARDPSRRDLADAMGVAASTAISHQRSVYAKLGVHSRADLLDALTLA